MSAYDTEKEDTTIYKVVVNHEQQYSIMSADRENPLGWTDAGKTGLKAECLAYINEVWTDMRPLSLRKKMEEMASAEPQVQPPPTPRPQEDDLVTRLSKEGQPVEAVTHPEKSLQALKEAIDRGYVHIKFTNTRGGTELGIRLDATASNLSDADFDRQRGMAHLEGDLSLDYTAVRCIADIDLQTLEGKGHLKRAEG